MKRMELIANRSVEKELIGTLEEGISGFQYTLLPGVHGRGKAAYRMGTATWPEENFMLISYLENREADRAKVLTAEVKARFPGEGIKLFFTEAEG
ncbi:MAG: hypothetical protein LBK02_09585 [Treponema sp.]|jgi:hypothetical protein|nr:hypothetical protein [Treponema sp.]